MLAVSAVPAHHGRVEPTPSPRVGGRSCPGEAKARADPQLGRVPGGRGICILRGSTSPPTYIPTAVLVPTEGTSRDHPGFLMGSQQHPQQEWATEMGIRPPGSTPHPAGQADPQMRTAGASPESPRMREWELGRLRRGPATSHSGRCLEAGGAAKGLSPGQGRETEGGGGHGRSDSQRGSALGPWPSLWFSAMFSRLQAVPRCLWAPHILSLP